MSFLTDHLCVGGATFRGETFSAAFLGSQIDLVARTLDERCRGRSPIVYLCAGNHVKTLSAYFGILKSGRVCLLVNPDCGMLEWTEMLRECPPGAIIQPGNRGHELDPAADVSIHDNELDRSSLSELDGVCTLLHTAADDGYAKAAMLTHDNMLANALSIVEAGSLDATSCCASLVPFDHLFGLQTGLIAPAICGARTCIFSLDDATGLREVVGHLRASRATHLFSVPLVYHHLGKAWEASGKNELPRHLVSGGCKLTPTIHSYYEAAFDRQIHEGYGLTEASPVCTWHSRTDQVRLDTVGRAISCCELSVQSDDGTPVAPNEVGEVCVRGSNVMKGYFNRPFASANAICDSWLRTGDLGYIDAEGFLHLRGLKKRMINVAGKKVFPAEVERLLRCHPNVKDVNVYPQPSPLLGQSVRVRVLLEAKGADAQNELYAWCKTSISGYKLPRRFEFVSDTSCRAEQAASVP
jgi:long-chain acyl-CoA synthetase